MYMMNIWITFHMMSGVEYLIELLKENGIEKGQCSRRTWTVEQEQLREYLTVTDMTVSG